jgi:hypothetical protein
MRTLSGRLGGILAALLVTTSVVGGLLAAASWAGEDTASKSPPTTTGGMVTDWDANHVYMDYSGNAKQVAATDERFVFDLTAVPGDSVYRTLTITNAGPEDGALSIYLMDPTLTTSDPAQSAELHQISNMYWQLGTDPVSRVKFATAMNHTTPFVASDHATHQRYPLSSLDIPQNQSVDLTLGWEFPLEETLGNSHGGTVTLTFGVYLDLRSAGGSTPPAPTTPAPTTPTSPTTPTPPTRSAPPSSASASATASPSPSGGGSGGNTATSFGELPFTGFDVTALVLMASVSGLLGLILIAWRRRREESEQQDVSGAGPRGR